jgi:hypothetical protein
VVAVSGSPLFIKNNGEIMRGLKLALYALILVSFNSVAAENAISAYRALDGEFTAQSESNLDSMIDRAKNLGTITVWVDFGIDFQNDPALRTPAVVANEVAMRDQAIATIVAPLIDQGKAVQIALDPVPMAPGCLLNVDHSGLKALAKNEGVKYIGYMPAVE